MDEMDESKSIGWRCDEPKQNEKKSRQAGRAREDGDTALHYRIQNGNEAQNGPDETADASALHSHPAAA